MYLNEHFRPLCYESAEGYSLWVRKERYDEVYAQLYGSLQGVWFNDPDDAAAYGEGADFHPIDYSHYNHNYNAGYIPFLWGEYDSKKAYKNEVVYEFISMGETIPISEQSRENYILIQIAAAQADIAHLTFADTNGTMVIQFDFKVNKGTHRYLVRPSADSYWRHGDLQIGVTTDTGSDIKRIALLMGD